MPKTKYMVEITIETQDEPTMLGHMATSVQLDRAVRSVPGVIDIVIADFDQLDEKGPAESHAVARDIIVNGIGFSTAKERLLYEDALSWASEDPMRNLSVTYRSRATNSGGILQRNGPFPLITEGMVINVADTGNA